jgi:TrmH family RNA methyltransferase
MQTISSRRAPIVGAFRELAELPDPAGRRLLLDGLHLVRDAHVAGLEFEVVVVAETSNGHASAESAMARQLADAGVEVLAAGDAVLSAISPVRTPSGIVGIARREPHSLRALVTVDEALLIVAVDVQDPGNIGSLVRAAEAAGVSGLVVCGASANPFSWKALRGSMGSALRLPIAAGIGLDVVLRELSGAGSRLVAAIPRGGSDPEAIHWEGRVAILLGGEGPGLDAPTVDACDERVSIPMAAPVESLNVAVAGALLGYAARRQRT